MRTTRSSDHLCYERANSGHRNGSVAVNPAICGAMFAQIEENRSRRQRVADATKAVLATTVILAVSALIGTQLLRLFGVSLDAFMVAGGGVLAWMGFSMLSGQVPSPTSGNAPSNAGASLTPFVLFAASPGTITGVIRLPPPTRGWTFPSRLWWQSPWRPVIGLVLLLVSRVAAKASEGGSARDMITRFMGLIVLSIGFSSRSPACTNSGPDRRPVTVLRRGHPVGLAYWPRPRYRSMRWK